MMAVSENHRVQQTHDITVNCLDRTVLATYCYGIIFMLGGSSNGYYYYARVWNGYNQYFIWILFNSNIVGNTFLN